MASSPQGVLAISPGERIAQLLLLPFHSDAPPMKGERGDKGFGSSDAYWIQEIRQTRPELQLKLNGKTFQGLLDTGADVSVIAARHWPSSWPTKPTNIQLQGLGTQNAPLQSSVPIKWEDNDGHSGYIQPFVISNVPLNLWGRDILAALGALICSPNEAVTTQMLLQGYREQQGLGKGGRVQQPLEGKLRPPRLGLGHSF
ncbi:endogenous retrovirus group K member 21 Pro protein-like [Fukomys damarensis]|uniref:endogenous retrovirus group K member 21 Pro protein-like n=1 Tax=Fukomys damarensis TaxID=885580 RepID=UPI00053FDBF7|nr:endogenous retrovirus group K member 21 Pro protein-like [Fukomys damarensis]